MNEISAIALVTAFGAGIVSFLSPCVLPLVPGYVSYVAGDRIAHGHHAGDAAWRKSIARIGRPVQIGAGAVMVLMGLAMITGQITQIALWLLNAFPGLATMG